MKLHSSSSFLYQIPPKQLNVVENKGWNSLTPPQKVPTTAIELIFTKLALNRQLFTENCYAAFHETPAEDLVADTRSQMAGRADLAST